MNRSMLAGITAAVLAAISWSLGYIVPFVIGKYSPFDFALVEFVFAGLLSAGLLWRKRAVVRLLTFNDWWVAGSLGLIGYACYFLAIMGSAIYAGPVVAPAFLGLVPVVLVIAGNLRRRTVSWRSLMLPLALATVGLVLVNGSSFTQSGTPQAQSLLLGIALALLAVIFWTVFGLLNQSALETRPHLDAGVWGTLIGPEPVSPCWRFYRSGYRWEFSKFRGWVLVGIRPPRCSYGEPAWRYSRTSLARWRGPLRPSGCRSPWPLN